jgi:hypothetical protein
MRAKFWSTVNVLTVIDAALLEKATLAVETEETIEETIEDEAIVVDGVVKMLRVDKIQELQEKTLVATDETTRTKAKRVK